MAKETIVAYETNWEDLGDQIAKALDKLGIIAEYYFSPRAEGFLKYIPYCSTSHKVGTFYPDKLSFVSGFTVGVTGDNIEDSITVVKSDGTVFLNNVHVTRAFIELRKMQIMLTGRDYLDIYYNNNSGTAKNVSVTVNYYDYLDIINHLPDIEFSTFPAQELEPPAADDSRHDSNVRIPPHFRRITLIFNSNNENNSLVYRYSNDGVIFKNYEFLRPGEQVTLAIQDDGALEWYFSGSFNQRTIYDKIGSPQPSIPKLPKHNSVYTFELETWESEINGK